jgi:hypothetical protein
MTCNPCEIERLGCGCDGAEDDGCFLCTPSQHKRPPCEDGCLNKAPEFTCALCGSKHKSTEKDNAPPIEPEAAAKLKGSWEASVARAAADPKGKGILEETTTAKLAASETRASIAYFGAIRRTDVWKVPDTLVSRRGPGQAWRLVCQSCTEKA